MAIPRWYVHVRDNGVSIQGTAFNECVRECVTLEWTLAAVEAYVCRQRAALGELCVALFTIERALSGMRSLVSNEAIHDVDRL